MTSEPRSVDGSRESARFSRLGFDRFREMALDPSLTEVEKMGGARGHREGYDDAIWASFHELLPALAGTGARVLDIGSGCGEIARRLIALAERNGHRLTMVDHAEMLDQLPASAAVERVAGRFPDAMAQAGEGGFDVVLAYSVLHIVAVDSNPFAFLDAAMARLAPGGRLLVGDVPNFSKLRRFLDSAAGAAFHRAYMRTDEPPQVAAFAPATDRIDDGLLVGLMLRARLAGFDAYLLPQPPGLAFANRREDLLVVRP
jgi:2-polyprenyl-3-methyl-5-hydroxy-6-metoxy-1,4-benzoquinol methylase